MLTLFGVAHTRTVCASCRASADFLRRETILPVPAGARAPLSQIREFGLICFDCAATEVLRRFAPNFTWRMARTTVANDRQEKLRLPGARIGLPFSRPSEPGDLARLHAWQDAVLPTEPEP